MSELSPQLILSEEYTVTIPVDLRRSLGLKPGDRLVLRRRGEEGGVELTPAGGLSSLRGLLDGVTDDFVREKEDRL